MAVLTFHLSYRRYWHLGSQSNHVYTILRTQCLHHYSSYVVALLLERTKLVVEMLVIET